MDKYLVTVSDIKKVDWLGMFARYVREGHAGKGYQVGAGSVSNALSAVGATIELAGKPNPLYKPYAPGQYWKAIGLMMSTYRNEDPAPQAQLAVPVALPHSMVTYGLKSRSMKHEAVGDLCNIAFYYLLRVGEYTATKKEKRKRTKAFRLKDLVFKRNHKIIPHKASLRILLSADECTLRITNQKNGRKGQCIHHQCTGLPTSPIKSLARRVHHILSNGGSSESYLCELYNNCNGEPTLIGQSTINSSIKAACRKMGLFEPGYGYTKKLVSSHSLRAGGAMALKLNGADRDTIRKQGRWSSDTFLMYIHENISAFAQGLSKKMSTEIIFRNIAGPTVTD